MLANHCCHYTYRPKISTENYQVRHFCLCRFDPSDLENIVAMMRRSQWDPLIPNGRSLDNY